MGSVNKYGSLRKHQQRARDVVDEIAKGKRPGSKITTAGVTPGGGKTLMAAIFAGGMADYGLIDQVLVVVPNDPLRRQMLEGFHDHQRGLDRFLSASSSQRTIAGTGRPFGQCVTYQRLTSERSAAKLAKWTAKKRTLVIFDECHHLCEDKAWERGAGRILEASSHGLFMSGTLGRWDEEKIPFIRYDASNKVVVDIRYTRADALSEQAILPVEFKLVDAGVMYSHASVPHDTSLSRATAKEQARALKTALKSADYVADFISTALGDWERYREQYYPSSAIVVCHSQEAARRAMRHVSHAFPKHRAALSLSDDGTKADRAIKRFRSGDVTVLVTVRKAYEGLDVPNASHLVYLGDSRSWPFLDQVIARVTRFNKNSTLSWSDQRGYVYTPADLRVHEYINNMMAEQSEHFREKERSMGTAFARRRSSFRPDSAELTSIGMGADGRVLTEPENEGIRRLELEYAWMAHRAPLLDKLRLATDLGLVPQEAHDA